MKLKLLLIILIFSFVVGCEEESTEPVLEVWSSGAFVKPNSNLIFKVRGDYLSKKEYKFQWSTNYGTLSNPNESETFYTAPSQTTVVEISLNIFENEGEKAKSKTFRIFVYEKLVLLKADDLVCKENNISDRWKKYINYILDNNIKTSIGLIGEYFEKDKSTKNYLKKISKDGQIDFFNHGYYHSYNQDSVNPVWEFKNSSYESQLESLKRTQSIIKNIIEIEPVAFGAPYNAVDFNTTKALKKVEEIKFWFNGLEGSGKKILNNNWIAENSESVPNFKNFKENRNKDIELYIIQLHPNHWDEESFKEFEKIIDYIKSFNYTFITTNDYFYSFIKRDYIF